MGCHSYGTVSTRMHRATGEMRRADLEMFVIELLDLRPSDIPEWAEYDWWRQAAIDWAATQAGELPRPALGGQA